MNRNIYLILCLRAMVMSLFPAAILSLFWNQELGIALTEIMILKAAFSFAVCSFEFPGGYIADRIGYRNSLLVGGLITSCGWGLYCIADSFWFALGAEIILGLGITFVSGCDQALLYESLKSEGRNSEYSRWNRNYVMIGQTGEALAALSAGWLYSANSRLPFYIETGIFLAAVVLVFFIKEPNRQKLSEKNHLSAMTAVIRKATVEHGPLRWILLLSAIFSLSSYFPVWIVQLYSVDAGVKTEWVGVVWFLANMFMTLGAAVSHRFSRFIGFTGTLLFCVSMVFIGYSGLALCTAWYGFLFYFFITFMRGINVTLMTEAIQSLAHSSQRASVLSLRSFSVRGLFALTAPAVGWGMDAFGYYAALFGLGAVFTTLLMVFWRSVKKFPILTEK